MKLKKLAGAILCVVLLAVFLTGCGPKPEHYDISDYTLELDYKKDFKVLQLTDIHVGNKDDRQYQYDFLDVIIRDADPDLILTTGDLFTFADKVTAKELFAFFDSYGIPWTVTFGNHDEQCYFSVDWLTDYLNNYGSNCVFKDLQNDDVYGDANFAINLMSGGTVSSQLILMDSNRYNYGEYIGYDYMKKDQIAWYEDLVNYTTAQNGGQTVPSICFFHIPVPEFDDAWEAAQAGSPDSVLEFGEKREKVCCPDINTGFFDKVLEMDSTKAIVVGHDHLNNFRVKYKGVYLCYGVTSTDRIYYDESVLGGHVITIHPDGSLDFEQLFHSYEEVE